MTAATEKKISIRTAQIYRQPYYYGDIVENITRNPFLDIVRETYKDTRSKHVNGPHYFNRIISKILKLRFCYSLCIRWLLS